MRGIGRDARGRWIQPERVVSRVLCVTHNNALSPLDTFAADFAEELSRTTTSAANGADVSSVARFSGDNLERWLLKILCGLVASGQAAKPDGTALPHVVHDGWVRCLFGMADFIPPCGLYVDGTIGSSQQVDEALGVAPISTSSGDVVGLEFSFEWLRCVLVINPWRGRPFGAIDELSIRRPDHVELANAKSVQRLEFLWTHSAGHGLTMTYTAAQQAVEADGRAPS